MSLILSRSCALAMGPARRALAGVQLAPARPAAFSRLSTRGRSPPFARARPAVHPARRSAPATVVPPLEFEEQDVGGEVMMVATLNKGRGDAATPFFLTKAELAGLRRFLDEPYMYSDTPRMLMLTGTIKSGKTRVLSTVLPGLLAARFARDPRLRRPVFFPHSFTPGANAAEAAYELVHRIYAFGKRIGAASLSVPLAGRSALSTFPDTLQQLAEHVHAEGGELWLLFDELQAPIVASTPADAFAFVSKLKRAVELCSPLARVVGTGSGMVSLLSAIRDSAPNGFALWDAVSHVSLGREPPAPAALAMAERILTARGRFSHWSPAISAHLTAQRACAELARGAHGESTSPRPALVSYLASLVVDDETGGTAPEIVLKKAVCDMLRKVEVESVADTVTALVRMRPGNRLWLRVLAEQESSICELRAQMVKSLSGQGIVNFASLLCEEEPGPARLLPPYGALLRSLVTRQGELAVFSCDENFDLAQQLRRNLQLIVDHSGLGGAKA